MYLEPIAIAFRDNGQAIRFCKYNIKDLEDVIGEWVLVLWDCNWLVVEMVCL
jgi:hypothetical protein